MHWNHRNEFSRSEIGVEVTRIKSWWFLGKIYFLFIWVVDKFSSLQLYDSGLYFLVCELRPILSFWRLLNCWAPNPFSSSSSLARAGPCFVMSHFSDPLFFFPFVYLRVLMMRLSPSKNSRLSLYLKVLKCSHTSKVLSSMDGNIIHRLWGLAHRHLLLLCLSHWFIPLNWISAKTHLFNEIISPISAFSITPAQYINFRDYSIFWKTLYNFFACLLLSHSTGI